MAQYENKGKHLAWSLLYVFSGLVDLAQIILDMLGIGILISELLEFIMPFVLIFVIQFICKVSLVKYPGRLMSIIGATGFDALTGGIAPFWILDVWYIHSSVKKEDARINAEIQIEENNAINQVYYADGVGKPRGIEETEKPGPKYVDGIGLPRGKNS